MTAIAFVGLGDMGGRMAARLLASGHELTVYNRTAERARPLVEAGAAAAASPADAARGAELAVTMLADPAALSAVVEGEAGLTEGLARDATLIEMSTVGPDAVERLRSVLPSSVGLLDSPAGASRLRWPARTRSWWWRPRRSRDSIRGWLARLWPGSRRPSTPVVATRTTRRCCPPS